MTTIARPSLAFLLMLILLTTGCNSSSTISTLQAVVSAVSAVFPIIGSAAGLPPAVVNQIADYLSQVSYASAQAVDIWDSSATPAAKAAQITALFSHIATVNLPPGTAQTVVSAITAVASAVAAFLATLPSQAATTTKATTPAPLSAADQAKLKTINSDALADLQKARALHM